MAKGNLADVIEDPLMKRSSWLTLWAKDGQQPGEAGKHKKKIPPGGLLKEHSQADTLISSRGISFQTSDPQNSKIMKVCCSQPLTFGLIWGSTNEEPTHSLRGTQAFRVSLMICGTQSTVTEVLCTDSFRSHFSPVRRASTGQSEVRGQRKEPSACCPPPSPLAQPL